MHTSSSPMAGKRLVVGAESAGEMMTLNPVSIRDTATVHDAAVLLTKRGISAAPVVDVAGRPVGVLSRTDIVKHDPESARRPPSSLDFYAATDPLAAAHEMLFDELDAAWADRPLVREIMTPAVLSVRTTDSVLTVISELVALKIHRVFVVDEQEVLVGVISAFDVLRKICADNPCAGSCEKN